MATTAKPRFISIVVPTHNRALLLGDCLGSLVQQTYPIEGYEIVVVDDGCTDGTLDIVQDHCLRNPRHKLRYVLSPARGLNVARNEGIRVSAGDPILLVDDDILAPGSWLSAVAAGVSRHPDASCLGGPVRLKLEGRAPRLCERDALGESALDLGEVERVTDTIIGANMAIPRAAITRVGLFDERLSGAGDESEWVLRLTKVGGHMVYLPEAWVWHRRTARDLRLFRLLRSKFKRGREQVIYEEVTGRRSNLSEELLPIPRFLSHAVRRRCAGGLFLASARAGRAWGIILARSRRLMSSLSGLHAR